MKNLFLFIFLLSTIYCLGQTVGTATRPQQGVNTGLISSNNRYGATQGKGLISYEEAVKEYDDIEGSAFLYGKELLVDLIFHNDSIIKDIRIKYDLYNGEIIVNKKDGSTIVLDQAYYKGFTYDNEGQEELYLRLQPNDHDFYQVLFSSNDFLFCKKMKIRIDDVTRHIPGRDIKSKKFMQKAEYFAMQNNTLLEVRLNNDAAVAYFPLEYRQQVPKLKQELKIRKLRKEQDYIRLMRAFE